MDVEGPYLLFLGDAQSILDAKTASGILDWRPDRCVAQMRLPECGVDLGLPEADPVAARAMGARTLVIGAAPFGGALAESWLDSLEQALAAGLNIASGLHERLSDVPRLTAAAARHGGRLYDVRRPGGPFAVASGARRSGRRLLTVGTDCAVGKKYTALAIARAMSDLGFPADFRATGQTGILIAGGGVPIDAVVSDFVAGAAESLSPANDPEHWDVIEGQGSLFHPAYAGVSLGLLHGSQPDAIVVCHAPGRRSIDGYDGFPVPDLKRCIAANILAARLTNPDVICAGVALNTAKLSDRERELALSEAAAATGLPVFDPMVHGGGAVVDYLADLGLLGQEPGR